MNQEAERDKTGQEHPPANHEFHIQIDRVHYTVTRSPS